MPSRRLVTKSVVFPVPWGSSVSVFKRNGYFSLSTVTSAYQFDLVPGQLISPWMAIPELKGVQLRPEKHMYLTWPGDIPSCFPSVGMLSWFHFSPSQSSGQHSPTFTCKHPPGTAFFPIGKPVRNFWVPPKPSFISTLKKVKEAQSCPTLCDPMNYTVHGIL